MSSINQTEYEDNENLDDGGSKDTCTYGEGACTSKRGQHSEHRKEREHEDIDTCSNKRLKIDEHSVVSKFKLRPTNNADLENNNEVGDTNKELQEAEGMPNQRKIKPDEWVAEAECVLDCPNNEAEMKAAVNLLLETNDFVRAKQLLAKARLKIATLWVYLQSAKLYWYLGELDEAVVILNDVKFRFRNFPLLWEMLGQLCEQQGDIERAREEYAIGVSINNWKSTLRLLLSRLEERLGNVARARQILDSIPMWDEMWLGLVLLELRLGNTVHANGLMSRALKQYPTSGILWAQYVDMGPTTSRLTLICNAMEKSGMDKYAMLCVVKGFWARNRIDPARKCLEKTLRRVPMFGDAWAYLYKLETMHGTVADRDGVILRCVDAKPRFGKYWEPMLNDIKNWRLKTQDLLPLVAASIPVPER